MQLHPQQTLPRSSPARSLLLPCLLLVLAASACGPGAPASQPGEANPGTSRQELVDENGITTNGLLLPALASNGLTTNGLAFHGLTPAGLSSAEFLLWFNVGSLGNADMVMKYVVRCALPAGRSLSWRNLLTGASYTWPGNLDLTPAWASGQPATSLELQLVSACLAAHVNRYGQSVPISMLGRNAAGTPLPIGGDELSTYATREGCFLGDLTTLDGIMSGSDRVSAASESSVRACALSTQMPGAADACPPVVYEGSCASLGCTLDSTGTWYEQCSANGKTFRPITTRMRSQDVYTCGDGVCQVSEHCGTGTTANSCLADCGRCP